MQLNLDTGWIAGIKHYPSPNYNYRPEGTAIDALVIHSICLPTNNFSPDLIHKFFANELRITDFPTPSAEIAELLTLKVAPHFLIDRYGQLSQIVSVLHRAWHAGISELAGRSNCNDFSIGVELIGHGKIPYTRAQYTSLAALSKLLSSAFPAITAARIVGHEHIAPARKTDPGPSFDWNYYRAIIEL